MAPAFSLPVDLVSSAKEELFSYSKQLKSESKTGVFISDYESKKQLKKLVAELEAVCDDPTEKSQKLMMGDWKLLCTTTSPSQDLFNDDIDTSGKKKKKFFGLPLPPPPEALVETFSPIKDKIRESVEVIQRIRKVDDYESVEGDVLNRVDNVIEFTPFTLDNIFKSIDTSNININPLEVSKSKVALVHSAKVQSVSPVLRTKLVLKSVVCKLFHYL